MGTAGNMGRTLRTTGKAEGAQRRGAGASKRSWGPDEVLFESRWLVTRRQRLWSPDVGRVLGGQASMDARETLLNFLCGAGALRDRRSSAMMLASSATRDEMQSTVLGHLQYEKCVVKFFFSERKPSRARSLLHQALGDGEKMQQSVTNWRTTSFLTP